MSLQNSSQQITRFDSRQSRELINARTALNDNFNSDHITTDNAWRAIIEYLNWTDRITVERLKRRWKNMVDEWAKWQFGEDSTRTRERRAGSEWYDAMTDFQKNNPRYYPRIVHDSARDEPIQNLVLTQARPHVERNVEENVQGNDSGPNRSALFAARTRQNQTLRRNVREAIRTRPRRQSNHRLLGSTLKAFKSHFNFEKKFKKNFLAETRLQTIEIMKQTELLKSIVSSNGSPTNAVDQVEHRYFNIVSQIHSNGLDRGLTEESSSDSSGPFSQTPTRGSPHAENIVVENTLDNTLD